MKLSHLLISLLFFALASTVSADPKEADYFPVLLGTEWHYDTSSNQGRQRKTKNVVSSVGSKEEGRVDVVITGFTSDVINFNSYFYKVPGWVYLNKSVNKDGNFTFDYTEDMKSFMNPPVVGKSWSYEGQGNGLAAKRDWKILCVEDVEVPAGKFSAIRIDDTSSLDGRVTTHSTWYAKDVGAVKTITTSQNRKGKLITTSVLTKMIVPDKQP